MRREVKRLQERIGVGITVLHFGNGTSRAIETSRVRNERLKLLLAAMDFSYDSPALGHPTPEQPRKITKFEPILQLFARATSVETDNSPKLIGLVHNLCRTSFENEEAKRAASDATPDGPVSQSTETA
jgi:hypothetical protein